MRALVNSLRIRTDQKPCSYINEKSNLEFLFLFFLFQTSFGCAPIFEEQYVSNQRTRLAPVLKHFFLSDGSGPEEARIFDKEGISLYTHVQ